MSAGMIRQDAVVRAHARRLVWGVALAGAGVLLSACSGGGGGVSAPVASAKSLSGRALGGQQPVVGATVTLYAASNGGYGTSNAPLATTTTVAGGNWSFSGLSCTSANLTPNVPLYVVATGGSAVGGSANSAIGLSSALGPCSTAITGTSYNIDEITTVASAFALAQFLDNSGQHLGTSASNATGLANAVANVAMLADLDAGTAQTVLPSGASGTLPAATLNTLGNLLAACVNTTSNTSTQCSGLISAATPAGGSAPSTTLQAALNIALNPGNNVAALYKLATYSNAPFQTPAPLGAQPNDWTLTVQFSGAGLINATDLAIDNAGAIWVTNGASTASVNKGHGSISEILPDGAAAAGSPFVPSGLNQPLLIALDGSDNVWVADNGSNRGQGSLYELSDATGGSLSGPYTSGLSSPLALAIDAPGNLWVANANNAISRLSSAGAYASKSFNLGNTISGITIDGSGNAWASLYYSNAVAALGTAGDGTPAPLSGSPYSGGGLTSPEAVAIDASGNVWVTNQQGNGGQGSVSKFNASGVAAAGSPFSGTQLNSPQGNSIAIDGKGRVWVANSNSSVCVLNADGSAAAPVSYGNDANLGSLAALAIDSSGDLWVVNSSGSGGLSKLVGVAAPVKTPLVGPAALP